MRSAWGGGALRLHPRTMLRKRNFRLRVSIFLRKFWNREVSGEFLIPFSCQFRISFFFGGGGGGGGFCFGRWAPILFPGGGSILVLGVGIPCQICFVSIVWPQEPEAKLRRHQQQQQQQHSSVAFSAHSREIRRFPYRSLSLSLGSLGLAPRPLFDNIWV